MTVFGFLLFFVGLAGMIPLLGCDQFFPWRPVFFGLAATSMAGFMMMFFGAMPQ